MKKILIPLLLTLIATISFARNISGSWKGALNAGAVNLRLVFHFTTDSNGKAACTLDSPDQGVNGIPAEVVYISSDSVNIAISSIHATYAGKVADSELKGTFTQMGQPFPLNLKAGTAAMSRPQEPKAPFPYTTEEVSFVNSHDGNTLSGTLCFPIGYEQKKRTAVPLVVMVTGSGQQNRDEEVAGHRPFLVIADFLARHGVASLRYDDRGAGNSTGNPATATSEDNKRDALAAVQFARKTKKFGKVGVLGHSEGGLIAFMLAADKATDFIVSLAAPAVRGDSILMLQHDRMLRDSRISESQINGYNLGLKTIYAALRKGAANGELQEALSVFRQQTGASLPEKQIQALQTPWMQFFLGYDPARDIKQTTCPVLALNGTSDWQVDCGVNLGTIRKLLPQNSKNVVREYPTLNHLFQHSPTGNPVEYGTIEETIAPGVLNDIAGWIKAL